MTHAFPPCALSRAGLVGVSLESTSTRTSNLLSFCQRIHCHCLQLVDVGKHSNTNFERAKFLPAYSLSLSSMLVDVGKHSNKNFELAQVFASVVIVIVFNVG